MSALALVMLALFGWLAPPGSPPPPDVGSGEFWVQPVDAPIVDLFRPPDNPYGSGNRGLEYGTTPGQSVTAVDNGVVVFAGQVGGELFVVVAHTPSLRSTYAYLESISVSAGDDVGRGQPVATAGSGFHLTARVNGDYVDPLPYFGIDWRVRLVAPADPGPIAGSVRYSL